MSKTVLPDYDNYKKRLRCFRQYKDLPQVKFDELAKKLYQKKYKEVPENQEKSKYSVELIENEVGVWLSKEEALEAKKIFNNYLEGKEGLDESKINLIKSLVNYEIQIKRINITIIEKTKEAQEAEKDYNPSYQIKSLNELNEQALAIRRALGLSDEKKSGEDPIQYFRILQKKFKVWMEENQGSRHIVCPHCSRMIMLKIRTEMWEALKSPFFFKDKHLSNKHLWNLYKAGTITDLDVAKVLLGEECKTPIFTHWLEKKIFNGQENTDPLKEEIKDNNG